MRIRVICIQLTFRVCANRVRVIDTNQTGKAVIYAHLTILVYITTKSHVITIAEVVIITAERMAINSITAVSLIFSILGTFIARHHIIGSITIGAWFGRNRNGTNHGGGVPIVITAATTSTVSYY